MKIALADKDAEIEPVPTDIHGHKPEPELDRLSNILKTFNEQFGTLSPTPTASRSASETTSPPRSPPTRPTRTRRRTRRTPRAWPTIRRWPR
jgi:type I restriction enzyme R subunit